MTRRAFSVYLSNIAPQFYLGPCPPFPVEEPGVAGSWNYWNYRFRQLAIRQAQRAMGTPSELQVMRCQHRGQAMGPVQILQQSNRALRGAMIEAPGGLIRQ